MPGRVRMAEDLESSDSNDSGKLNEISWTLEPLTGKLALAGRCHRLPRRLEHDYSLSSKVLGTGYNGKVHLARSRINAQQTVAVKTFKLKGLSESKKERLMAETSVFLCMDHPHVARLLDVYESDNHISLVMECMEGGELFDRVTNAKRFTEPQAANATRQMLLALNYLHSNGMVHRDVKLENFLYDDQQGDHLKMIDFGFSKFYDTKGRMKTSCGTLAYVAPEVLKRSYTAQCDLWSMGVIVFILLSGRMPFSGDSEEQISDIKKGKYTFRAVYWSNVSQAALDFTKAMLEVDPNKRLTAKTALENEWLKKGFQGATLSCDASILRALCSWASAPKLHRACMSMMAWSLTNKHHAQVRDHFLALNKSHDGAVSLKELKEVLEGENFEENEIPQIFDLLSQGHEDKIHYSDFLAAMVSTHLDVDDHLFQMTFKKFDRRCSGFIAPQDLKNIFGASFYGDDVEGLIQDADLDGDGKLSYTEFKNYLSSSRARLIVQQTQQEKQIQEVVSSHAIRGGTLSRNPPVLLGNSDPSMQRGATKGSPFAKSVATGKGQEVVLADDQKHLFCCIVQ